MKRTTGITASAVIAIIGSVGTILLGALVVLASIFVRSTLQQNPTPGLPPEAAAMNMSSAAVVYVGFGVWGIVSAIGVLRLRNWARICFAVFGGILAVFSLLVILGILLIVPAASQIQRANAGSSPDVFVALIVLFVVIALAITALGIWWLVYFNRQRVRVLFSGGEPTAVTSRLPLSISIVSWFLIAGGIVVIPRILAPSPLLVFSFIVHGFAVRVIYLLIAAASLLSGIGMLKKVKAAHSLALIYGAYGLVNALASFLIPGSSQRRNQFIQEIQGAAPAIMPLNSIVTISIGFSLVLVGVGLWILITRREAFLEAARG